MKNLTRSCTRLTLTSQQKLGDGGAQHESADFLGLGMPMPLCRGIALRYNRTSQRGQASYMIGWSPHWPNYKLYYEGLAYSEKLIVHYKLGQAYSQAYSRSI